MRRYFVTLICAIAALQVPQIPASAQAAPDLCTATVYIEPGLGLSAENAELRAATNLLSARGIDARILLLQDLDGAAEVKEYERTTLARECPDLVQDVDGRLVRKRDLFMVVLAIPMRQKGAIFGDNPAGNAHSEDVFSEVANPFLRAGSENNDPQQFADGVLAYFEELDDRIVRAEDRPASEPSEPSKPFNWAPIAIGLLVLAALGVLVVVYFISVRFIRARRSHRARKAELQERLDRINADYQDLTLQTDIHMLNIDMWIDKLPDSDDGTLKELKVNIDQATAEGADAIDQAEELLQSARSEDELALAEAEVNRAEAVVSRGMEAKRAAEPLFDDLQAKYDGYPSRMRDARSMLSHTHWVREETEQKGFRMNAFVARLTACERALDEADQAFASGAVLTADNLLTEQQAGLQDTADELQELPVVPGMLEAEAVKLDGIIAELNQSKAGAKEVLEQMLRTYRESDTNEVSNALEGAGEQLSLAAVHVVEARKAATMDVQDFDGARTHLLQAGTALDEARQLINSVTSRKEGLTLLEHGLPGTVQELKDEASRVIGYITQVREDVEDDTATEANRIISAIDDTGRLLQANKPPLREIKAELDKLNDELEAADDQAKAERKAKQELREEIKRERKKAKDRLKEAHQYRSYADGHYRTADDFVSGSVMSMSLQQQLLHWQGAYAAADKAYDEGKDGYDDAHKPTYTPSYSSSNDGGSSSSSWSSPSIDFGGGGGSTSSSW